jgi:radical SAM superfamily enzyme YgiQ (UPF0313 family)
MGRLKIYLMFGFPWEKDEDIRAVKAIIEPYKREGIEVVLCLSAFIPSLIPHSSAGNGGAEGLAEKSCYKESLKSRG